jgi:nucleotide-binding universal stress UspA family protein
VIPEQIVFATDFSPASSAALCVAGRVARIFNANVVVVHVFEYVAHHQYQVPVGWMIECIRRDVQRRMSETRKIFADIGVKTEGWMIEDGFPSLEIPNALQKFKNPLLVMGTHAVGGMDRFVLGSTAEEILRRASCPVITVGPHVSSKEADDPRFHKLLYATDFSDASLVAAPFAAMFRKSSAASLRVLHVSADPNSHGYSEAQSFEPAREALGDDESGNAGTSSEYVTLHGKDIGQAITNEAERYPADLLVLGVNHASAFAAHLTPKIAFQVIAAAPCAVLTVSS